MSWNPESSNRNPESTVGNPESKTVMDSLTWGDYYKRNFNVKVQSIQNQLLPCQLNPRTYTQNHTPTMVREDGIDGTPPQSF